MIENKKRTRKKSQISVVRKKMRQTKCLDEFSRGNEQKERKTSLAVIAAKLFYFIFVSIRSVSIFRLMFNVRNFGINDVILHIDLSQERKKNLSSKLENRHEIGFQCAFWLSHLFVFPIVSQAALLHQHYYIHTCFKFHL